jgi:hypothetical protein
MQILLLAVLSLVHGKICQHIPPTDALRDELRLCRKLNYAFCIEVNPETLRKAKPTIGDLPDEIAHASINEATSTAILADRYLVSLYDDKVTEAAPSQTCLHFWSLAVCSEVFSKLGEAKTLCFNTCKAVADHCTSSYLTELCREVIRTGVRGSVGCVDYSSLACNETCTIGDPHKSPPAQQYTIAGHFPVANYGRGDPQAHTHHLKNHEHHHHNKHNDNGDNDAVLVSVDCLVIAMVLLNLFLTE